MSKAITAQQLLRDAEDEYTKAVYRFREAEEKHAADYSEARREMNRLEKRLQWMRQCIYSNKPHLLFKKEKATVQTKICPEPEWGDASDR